jgi:hypothetical protein
MKLPLDIGTVTDANSMKPRVLLSLCFIALLACEAPDKAKRTKADVSQTAPPQASDLTVSKDAALRIAKDFFSKEQSTALSQYEITIEDDPKTGRWVVYFFGGSPQLPRNMLTIVLVDKKSGKASIHGT